MEEENKSFEELLNDSMNKKQKLDKIVEGKVINVTSSGEIYVDINYKADGIIPKNEYSFDENANPADEFKPGDSITAEVIKMNDGLGNVLLSYKKLKAKLKRDEFEKKVENKEVFEENVSSSNPNGLIVEYNGIRIFIPNSLSAGQKDKVRFRVIEYNPKEHKVIGSCKVLVDEAKAEKEKKFWDEAKEGKEYEGTVASISSYGAFIDINGVQGLLHISEMSWDREAKANEILKEGQKVKVRIKTLDKENKRIQLAYDGKGVDPWETLSIKVGDVLKVKIKSIKPFGAFANVAPTIDGLIHISQISSEKIAKPEDKLKVGQEVEVKVINVDKENKKVELSIKELEGKKVEGANSNEETASGETILWSSETAAQENNEEVKEEIKENLEGDESAKN